MPVVDYINRQAVPEKARLIEALAGIETHGFEAPRVGFRQIRGKLWEIKIVGRLAHRIFYASVEREEIILLHAYTKKSQKAPTKEVKVAEKRMKEVL